MPGTPQRPDHWMRMQPRDGMSARPRYGADRPRSSGEATDRGRELKPHDRADAFVSESIRDRYYR